MSERTGLGPIEVGVLDSLHAPRATFYRPSMKTQRVLDAFYDRHPIGPRLAFRWCAALVRPDVSHLRLVDFHRSTVRLPPRRLPALLRGPTDSSRGRRVGGRGEGDPGMVPVQTGRRDHSVGGPHVRRWPPVASVRRCGAATAGASDATWSTWSASHGSPLVQSAFTPSRSLPVFRRRWDLFPKITPVGTNELLISHLPPDVANRDIFDAVEDEASEQPMVGVARRQRRSTMVDGTRLFVSVAPATTPTLSRRSPSSKTCGACHTL